MYLNGVNFCGLHTNKLGSWVRDFHGFRSVKFKQFENIIC
jgi:hypothetical protein